MAKNKETTEKGHQNGKETDHSQSVVKHKILTTSGLPHDLRKTSAHVFMESRETSLN